jgi:hypothetical protein
MRGFAQHALPESGRDRVTKHEIDPASEASLRERREIHVGVEGL